MDEIGPIVIKKCTKCDVEKELKDFWKDVTKPSGRHSQCIGCARHTRKKNYCPKRSKRWALKQKYDMTLEDYDFMFIKQGGVCKVCKDPERSKDRLCVDHCHTTGNVRSLLCSGCNKAFGLLDENVDYMSRLIHYKRNHK